MVVYRIRNQYSKRKIDLALNSTCLQTLMDGATQHNAMECNTHSWERDQAVKRFPPLCLCTSVSEERKEYVYVIHIYRSSSRLPTQQMSREKKSDNRRRRKQAANVDFVFQMTIYRTCVDIYIQNNAWFTYIHRFSYERENTYKIHTKVHKKVYYIRPVCGTRGRSHEPVQPYSAEGFSVVADAQRYHGFLGTP